MNPGVRMGLRVARKALLYLAGLAPLVVLLDALDSGADLGSNAVSLVTLLLPLCLCGATAQVFVSSRIDGEWDLDSLHGFSPGSRLMPLLALSAVGAAVTLLSAGQSSLSWSDAGGEGLWAIPAPVDGQASMWLEDGAWTQPDLGYWMSPPGTLSTGALLERIRSPMPTGARRGVDHAELLRRIGWSLSLPLAVLLGVRAGRRWGELARRKPGSPGLSGVVAASGVLLLWLLAVLVLAAYLPSTM